ncbi:MAG: hypothetical protein SFU83_18735 [Meiothermus sp.]|nr:hypothetical protein [Meiothermus sp.]
MTGKRRNDYAAGGWVLLVVGLSLLLGQFFPNNGWQILALLGVGFLAAGALIRKVGLLIPGGILSGIALGVYLVDPVRSSVPEATAGGVFLMAFAAGWFMITLLSPLAGGWVWWPLIPGSILGFIGWAVYEERLEWLERLSWVWPLILVGLGAWVLLRPKNPQDKG